jgi:KUP system potassium uptake protein
LREAFHGPHGIPVTSGNILGVLSLIFWSLVLIVTIKYHLVIIRADNKGEGGILALMALVQGSRLARGLSPRRAIVVLGIFGRRSCTATSCARDLGAECGRGLQIAAWHWPTG